MERLLRSACIDENLWNEKERHLIVNVIKLRLLGIENHPTTIFSKSRVAFLLKNDHVLSIRHGHKGQPPFRETALWYGI